MGIAFFCFFQSRTRSASSHQKLRLSQRHGAPLLTKNLGNQHTAPANQELGEQEKGRLLLTSQIEGVVQPEAQPTATTSAIPIFNYDPQFNSAPATHYPTSKPKPSSRKPQADLDTNAQANLDTNMQPNHLSNGWRQNY
jgi:hypothetical protein